MIMQMWTKKKEQVLRMTFIIHLLVCFISASSCSNKVHKDDLWNGSQLWVEACQIGKRSIRRREREVIPASCKAGKVTAYVQLKGDKWSVKACQLWGTTNREPLEIFSCAEKWFLALKKGNLSTNVKNKLWRRMSRNQLTHKGGPRPRETFVNQDQDCWPGLSRLDNDARKKKKKKKTKETWLYTCASITNYKYEPRQQMRVNVFCTQRSSLRFCWPREFSFSLQASESTFWTHLYEKRRHQGDSFTCSILDLMFFFALLIDGSIVEQNKAYLVS